MLPYYYRTYIYNVDAADSGMCVLTLCGPSSSSFSLRRPPFLAGHSAQSRRYLAVSLVYSRPPPPPFQPDHRVANRLPAKRVSLRCARFSCHLGPLCVSHSLLVSSTDRTHYTASIPMWKKKTTTTKEKRTTTREFITFVGFLCRLEKVGTCLHVVCTTLSRRSVGYPSRPSERRLLEVAVALKRLESFVAVQKYAE